MYEIRVPEKWGDRVSGSVRWPEVIDFNENNWESYRAIIKAQAPTIKDSDQLHYGWRTAAHFTIDNGTCAVSIDGEQVDFSEWLEDESKRRIAIMNWLAEGFKKYLHSEVLDPKG